MGDEEIDPRIEYIQDEFLELTGEVVKLSILLNELPWSRREALRSRYNAFLTAINEMPSLPPEVQA